MSARSYLPSDELARRLLGEIALSHASATDASNALVETCATFIADAIPREGRRQAMAILTRMMCERIAEVAP
jgi:esterase/lipase superfamily enzyme